MQVQMIMPRCLTQQVTCRVRNFVCVSICLLALVRSLLTFSTQAAGACSVSHKDHRQFMTIATQQDIQTATAAAANRRATNEKIIAHINKPQNALKGASTSLFTTTANNK